MDNEKCTVNDDIIGLLGKEIGGLATKPNDFLYNFISNKKIFNSMADIFQESEIDAQRLLRSTTSRGVKAKDISEIIRFLKEEIKKRNVQETKDETFVMIKSYIPDAPVADHATLPLGYYFIDDLGIVKKRDDHPYDIVSYCPIFITCIKYNVITNTEYVTLVWILNGSERSVTVERRVIAKSSLIVDLSNNGIPITSNNANLIVEYLSRYENTNSLSIERVEATHKLGWTNHMEGFLWGHQFFSSQNAASTSSKKPAIEFWGRDQGDEQIADGFCSNGDYATWISLVNDIFVFPDVIFLVYVSLTAPFLPIFGVKNFSLELSNQSSSGKTTALLLGASCWGVPELHASSFVNTWNATPVWIGRAASVLNGLPLYLDETKLAKSQNRRGVCDLVSDTIYKIAAGRDKARGTLQGTERTEQFRTILFSTGESPSLGLSNDGGSRGRLIDLWGNPFLKTDKESKGVVDRINRTIENNYGHAGPKLVQYLLNNREQWRYWREAYQEANRLLTQTASMSPIEMRLGEYFAAIATAIPIIHAAIPELRRNSPVKDLLDYVWERATKEAREADIGTQALQLVYELITLKSNKIYSDEMASQGIQWVGGDYIGIKELDKNGNWISIGLTTDTLRELLKKYDFNMQEIIRNWNAKGWLLRNESSGGYQRQMSIPGTSDKSRMHKINLYCLKAEAFQSEE